MRDNNDTSEYNTSDNKHETTVRSVTRPASDKLVLEDDEWVEPQVQVGLMERRREHCSKIAELQVVMSCVSL